VTATPIPLPVEVSFDALRAEIDHLRTALETRDVIGQAKGILMNVHKIDADEAFELLVGWSQREGIKVHALAARVIATEV
jgi:AmiR/NasT family two-component response regulator